MTERPRPNVAQPPKVAYLTKRFPRLSETFILHEIIGLERAGVRLALYSVADPGEGLTQPDVAEVRSSVTYVRSTGPLRFLKGIASTISAHAKLAVTDPRRYRAAFAAARLDRARSGTIRPFLDAGRLAVQLNHRGVGHLHAAFAHGPASTARLVNMLTGIPYSFSAHAKDLYLSDGEDLAAKAGDATFVLTCSRAARDALVMRAGSPKKVILAYHGVDSERFRPAHSDTAPPRGPARILAVGRLVEKKGYPVLLEALAAMAHAGAEFQCEIIGGGPDREALEALAQSFDISDRVAFAGSRTQQQVAASLNQADLFVQSSVVLADGDRDGIPNSLLEAMATALPVVASEVCGIPEAVVHGSSGLLVSPGDPKELAEALGLLIRDPELAQRLGRGARLRVVEHFDRRRCIQEIAPLFDRESPANLPIGPEARR
jgi:glycosyltransferase involved in cell wall biosynthesis